MKILFSFIFIIFSTFIRAKVYGEPYLVYIKPNARLTQISDNAIVKSRKGFYAKVYELNPENRTQFYVFDSSGEAKYIVEAKGIVEILGDIQLLPGEKGNITYPAKSNFRSANYTVPLESEFTVSFDQMNLAPLASFIKTEISDINVPRFKANILYKTEFPLNIGINFNYQATSWKDQNGTASTLTCISTGPEIKYRLFNTDDYFLSAITSFEFSPLYKISSDNSNDKFSAYMWNIGFNNHWKTDFGYFIIGMDFRKQFLTFKNSDHENDIKTEEYILTSAGINFGYKIDWEL